MNYCFIILLIYASLKWDWEAKITVLLQLNGQVDLLRCDTNISVMLRQIRKVVTLIAALTYNVMLCSKFIALIAITWKVLFAFIKSDCSEKDLKEKEREREKERDLHHYGKQIVKQDIKF